jgi:hypothetical protein
LRVGISIRDYDDMTPRELNLHIEVHNEGLISELNESRQNAYLTAYWGRVKRMPDLKKLLIEQAKPKKAQSDDEMLAMIKRLHKSLGGEEGTE